MSAHNIADFFQDDDGWYFGKCACGFQTGACPDDETVIDVLMDHAYMAGLTEAKP